MLRPDPWALRALYGDDLPVLDARRRAIRIDEATIVHASYETPHAPSGGLTQVLRHLPAAQRARGANVLAVGPAHTRLARRRLPDLPVAAQCRVPFGGGEVPLTILHDDGQPTPWYLLRAGGFFEGDGGASGADPYQDRRRDPLLRDRLLRDSLFFAAALPHALAALGIRRDVILHAHDWELASCGLTVKEALLDGVLERALTVLTLHNPYDRGLSVTDLALLTPRCDPLDWPAHPARREARRQTVLQAMVPLFDAPLTTVSRRFAHELTEDPLLVGHFVDHLQEVFGAQTVQGIDNGPFGPLTPPFGDAVTQAEAGDWAPLRAAKQAARAAMLQVLEDLPATHETYGRLLGAEGGAPTSLPGDVPVFFMFGRLDPGQKGFDLLARAIEAQPEGAARYVLAPLTTPEAAPFLQDLRHLARQRLGEVVVFPQRIQRGYAELMAGASFAVLPSFYEPFGAATEPLLAGTPVVARATGGLSDQIRDALDTHGAGYLFRETIPETDDAQRGWREVQARQDPLERRSIPLYAAATAALSAALGRAQERFRADPDGYLRLIVGGWGRVQAFRWEDAASAYARLYGDAGL